jgi:uncharacterized protein (DUF1800 family)
MQFLKGPLAVAVCLSLLPLPLPVAGQTALQDQTPRHAARPAYQSGQLRGDDRILHALNRFTFGPRPGDLEMVRTVGLDKWFEQQLHPASLDLADLNARLAQFPAMQWRPEDLLYRIPSNAVIRQAMNGKAPIPERGTLHAIYENQIYRITARKQAQEQKREADLNKSAPTATSTTGPTSPAMVMDGENSTPMAKQPASSTAIQGESGQMNPAAPEAESSAPALDESLFNSLLALPAQQRVARLAAMRPPEFEDFFKSLRPVQRNMLTGDLTPEQREVVAALEGPERLVAEELIAQRLTRDIYSTAQLQEVMTDFWLNHFNVYLRKNETTPYYLVAYERDVIRPRALGKFEDLLEATAHSPAMMLYLDNAESIGPDSMAAERAKFAAPRRPDKKKKAHEGLNENYARELMELHTLGVNGGYTQADVTQVARIFTGWTVERPQRGGGFEFDPNRHEPGTKKALGQKFKEHGELEGRELLHFLAARPATAQFISRKLAVRFVSDDPPQSLVDRLAGTYLSSGGDISAVLRTLFHSPEFWSSSVYRAKVKTPLEYVVSTVRASDANIDNLRPLANALRTMGMPLYGCVPPTGYNWQTSAWVSTGALVDRMNFALALAANRLPGISATWVMQSDTSTGSLLASDIPGAESEEARLESLIVAGGVSDSTRSAVLQQFQQQSAQAQGGEEAQPIATASRHGFRGAAPSALERQDQLLAGLLIGSPEFQRR